MTVNKFYCLNKNYGIRECDNPTVRHCEQRYYLRQTLNDRLYSIKRITRHFQSKFYQFVSWFPKWYGLGFHNYNGYVYSWSLFFGFWELRKFNINIGRLDETIKKNKGFDS
jgi:hypothetical protein